MGKYSQAVPQALEISRDSFFFSSRSQKRKGCLGWWKDCLLTQVRTLEPGPAPHLLLSSNHSPLSSWKDRLFSFWPKVSKTFLPSPEARLKRAVALTLQSP